MEKYECYACVEDPIRHVGSPLPCVLIVPTASDKPFRCPIMENVEAIWKKVSLK